MDTRQILIHQAVVRRAHSEYIVAKISAVVALLVIAIAFAIGISSQEAGGILLIIGVIANIFTARNLRKAENKMKNAEKKLLDLQEEKELDIVRT